MDDKNAASLFERKAPQLVDAIINQILEMRKSGVPEAKIMQDLFMDWQDQDAHIVWEMALARLQDIKEPRVRESLFMSQDDLRFATHKDIAAHRAKRLACNTLVEVGCGIGSQTLAFAKTCKKVIGIDIDARKIAFAMANCEKMGIVNVEFICADGIDALESLSGIDVVFCDPQRAPSAQERSVNALEPSPLSLLEITAHKTKNLAIELPPQIKEVPINGELEYASIDGKLARLTLYRGSVAKGAKSAVVLPSGDRLDDTMPESKIPEIELPLSFLFEVDEAVVVSGLVSRIQLPGLGLLAGSKPCLMTSSLSLKSPFFRAAFRVIEVVDHKDQVRHALIKNHAQKAIIRFAVDPKEYWAERKAIETGLTGSRHFHVFSRGTKFILAEKMPSNGPVKS